MFQQFSIFLGYISILHVDSTTISCHHLKLVLDLAFSPSSNPFSCCYQLSLNNLLVFFFVVSYSAVKTWFVKITMSFSNPTITRLNHIFHITFKAQTHVTLFHSQLSTDIAETEFVDRNHSLSLVLWFQRIQIDSNYNYLFVKISLCTTWHIVRNRPVFLTAIIRIHLPYVPTVHVSFLLSCFFVRKQLSTVRSAFHFLLIIIIITTFYFIFSCKQTFAHFLFD